mmetsp:Transcript_16047/g.17965  ORF Transcript_16047/g.17965 Transcript_16047/m.17965 type:complete len:174 (+) Transcript_16047:170-691(+)|eukprot:CAMPEP_0170799184 /NCGR_PEP_ID=MMETSP0733-20121128/26865_1 /TAXON_ID=186038 /ORGANISM="Fragilariopsis kerguelensis, Strain L26-C5" /LENGTH=173 /DNA_ID=CAMNT_0011150809 /DNA_START=117 /DNA_END=638 /DNA_ORIENTATION=+
MASSLKRSLNTINSQEHDGPVQMDEEKISMGRKINTRHVTFQSSFSSDSSTGDSCWDSISSSQSSVDDSLNLNLSEDDETIDNSDEAERNNFFLTMKHEASMLTQPNYDDDDNFIDRKTSERPAHVSNSRKKSSVFFSSERAPFSVGSRPLLHISSKTKASFESSEGQKWTWW